MVIRRAYWVMRGAGGDLVAVGDDDRGVVAAQAGNGQLADGAGVAGQFHGGAFMDAGLVVPRPGTG